MALTTDLDIHKQGVLLLSLSVDVQANMRRDFRASLGVRIGNECVELLMLIARANAARIAAERVTHIERLLERLDAVIFLLRVTHGKKLISHTLWASSIQLTDTIGRQAGGWLKSARTPRTAAPAA